MNLAFVSTTATTVEGQPHEFAGRTVEVIGPAAYGKNQSECRLLGDKSGDIAYVRDLDLHRFTVRKDVNGFVVQNIRPDGYSSDGPSHRSVEDAARWFAENCVGVPA